MVLSRYRAVRFPQERSVKGQRDLSKRGGRAIDGSGERGRYRSAPREDQTRGGTRDKPGVRRRGVRVNVPLLACVASRGERGRGRGGLPYLRTIYDSRLWRNTAALLPRHCPAKRPVCRAAGPRPVAVEYLESASPRSAPSAAARVSAMIATVVRDWEERESQRESERGKKRNDRTLQSSDAVVRSVGRSARSARQINRPGFTDAAGVSFERE
ncbi:hypothetical protein DBV15_09161 [Temnothorax longispinosus]|uniref:Uncharacterized protein n=1 Tax=Temnothorax longispinosus TaxID=300112 RepID=A0A4S2K5Z2_9HYME|nr:hypothetical protein DBV15_09161 [Temnothorax longispinosus]